MRNAVGPTSFAFEEQRREKNLHIRQVRSFEMLQLESILVAESLANSSMFEILRDTRFLGSNDLVETLRRGANLLEGKPGDMGYLGEV